MAARASRPHGACTAHTGGRHAAAHGPRLARVRRRRHHGGVPNDPAAPARVRHATPEDAPALVELRALMLAGMGTDPGPADSPWRLAAHAWFAERLARGSAVAVVAEHPVDGVVAAAVGAVEQHAPSPSSPDGSHARVSTVVTRPEHRGRGLARRCTTALLDRLRAETSAHVVELNATPPAEPLYRALGFSEPRFVALQARLR